MPVLYLICHIVTIMMEMLTATIKTIILYNKSNNNNNNNNNNNR
jgi:hypothetical protein